MLRCIRAAIESLLIGPLKHNGITTSDGEPLQCQEGGQGVQVLTSFPLSTTTGKVWHCCVEWDFNTGDDSFRQSSSASGSGGREMEKERKTEGETCRMTRGREVVVGAHNHCTTWWLRIGFKHIHSSIFLRTLTLITHQQMPSPNPNITLT